MWLAMLPKSRYRSQTKFTYQELNNRVEEALAKQNASLSSTPIRAKIQEAEPPV